MKNNHRPALVLCALFFLCACGQKPAALSPEEVQAASDQLKSTAPSGLPSCPELISIQEVSGTPQAGTATLFSSQPPEALLEFYTSSLAGHGWVLGTSAKQGQDQHLLFRQGDGFLRVQIGPAKGTTKIQLIWGGLSGGESIRESYEPDFEESPEEVPEEDDGGGRGW